MSNSNAKEEILNQNIANHLSENDEEIKSF